MKKIVSCFLVYLYASAANAGLMLNIYEDSSNDVVFEFSGSSTVNQGANNYIRNGFWFGDIADGFYTGSTGAYNALSENFYSENVTQGTNSGLNDVYLNGTGSGHELGIRLNNYNILTNSNDGDLITWSGLITLDIDFSDFMTGIWTGDRLIANGTDELFLLDDGYTITIGDAAAVSEPASIALLGLGLAGLGFSRRKAKA